MAWAGDWGSGDMLEEVEDTELKSPKRSLPACADADTDVAPTARNGLKASPLSSWDKNEQRFRHQTINSRSSNVHGLIADSKCRNIPQKALTWTHFRNNLIFWEILRWNAHYSHFCMINIGVDIFHTYTLQNMIATSGEKQQQEKQRLLCLLYFTEQGEWKKIEEYVQCIQSTHTESTRTAADFGQVWKNTFMSAHIFWISLGFVMFLASSVVDSGDTRQQL